MGLEAVGLIINAAAMVVVEGGAMAAMLPIITILGIDEIRIGGIGVLMVGIAICNLCRIHEVVALGHISGLLLRRLLLWHHHSLGHLLYRASRMGRLLLDSLVSLVCVFNAFCVL